MRRLVIYGLILLIAIVAGLFLKQDPGYILIAYKKWTIETSLWFGLILIAIALLCFYHLVRLIYFIFSTHGNFLRWYKHRQFLKAHTLTGAGLLSLEEADWEEAESLLLRGIKSSSIPVVNYLAAARAAHEQLDYKKRDLYLQEALAASEGKERLAVLITTAKLALEHHQNQEASEILERLQDEFPKHRYLLKLLAKSYYDLKAWGKLADLLPRCNKRHVFDEQEQYALEVETYIALFESLTANDALKHHWREAPKSIKNDARVIASYAKQLATSGEEKEVESIISDYLKKQFSEDLVKVYGTLHAVDPKKRLARAEVWLTQYGESITLLNALARISCDAREYEQSKRYAERSVELHESLEAYGLIAQACKNLDYKDCLESVSQKIIALTMNESAAGRG